MYSWQNQKTQKINKKCKRSEKDLSKVGNAVQERASSEKKRERTDFSKNHASSARRFRMRSPSSAAAVVCATLKCTKNAEMIQTTANCRPVEEKKLAAICAIPCTLGSVCHKLFNEKPSTSAFK